MLETYAAWLEGTTEADLRAIQKAMEVPAATKAPESPKAVTRLSLGKDDNTQVPDFWWKLLAEREGFEFAAGP
jgi:hypothetical protein